jgi:hypothetical protein
MTGRRGTVIASEMAFSGTLLDVRIETEDRKRASAIDASRDVRYLSFPGPVFISIVTHSIKDASKKVIVLFQI